MSWRSTKQRRAATRRHFLEGMLKLDAGYEIFLPGGPPLHVDPWGRPCGLGTWAYWFEQRGPHRFLRRTYLPGGFWVSTVWTGLWPSLWESMIFGPDGESRGYVQRYNSRRKALAGHAEMVVQAKRDGIVP
jgi:hypothetical protein